MTEIIAALGGIEKVRWIVAGLCVLWIVAVVAFCWALCRAAATPLPMKMEPLDETPETGVKPPLWLDYEGERKP